MKNEDTALDISNLPGLRDALHHVPASAADLIVREAFRFLIAHPESERDVAGSAHRFWEEIRGLVYDEGTGRRVEHALCISKIDAPTLMLQNVLNLCRGAGSLQVELIAEIDRLTAQLSLLRSLAVPTFPHAV